MRPLNLAHRGARRQAPENTIPAFVRAMELGADGIELDVHLSADGELVIVHDFTLEKTTSGRGRVDAQPLAALRALDAGSHFGPAWAGTPIPTLGEVFDALPVHAYVNIELKYDRALSNGLEQAAATFIQARALHERVIVSSFNPLVLARLRRLDPTIPLGLLYAPDMPPGLRHGEFARWLDVAALHPHWSQIRPATIAAAHAAGRQVNTWTVNEPEVMQRLIARGADAIITDVPDLLATVLANA